MYELFYKYLILNRKAILPGVGSFLVQRIPSKMDFVTRSLSAPSQTFSFDASLQETDKSFYEFLVQELKADETQVVSKFTELSHQIKDKALQDSGIQLPGIGLLKGNGEGNLHLIPDELKNEGLQTIYLDNSEITANANLVDVYDSAESTIITQEVEIPADEKIIANKQEDYWWVYAIILALMGVGALLYYYI